MNGHSPRTILVTGASSGIGRASTYALLDAGFRVFAGVRNERAAETLTAGAPAATHQRLETLELDVTNPGHIGAAVARIGQAVGEAGLWGLFNNAGIAVAGPIECTPLDSFRRQIEINLIGQIAVTQAFLPLLRRARGRILITGSIAGFGTLPTLAPYSMSKHAVEALADGLRRELRPWGIEVSLLEPGSIATDIWQKSAGEFQHARAEPVAGLEELYGPLLDAVTRQMGATAAKASPVSIVTRDVVHVFTAQRPKTRYCKGHGAGQRKVLRRLPDRWVDAIFARVLRWG
jgi:NAD(P)-dependent dehydrogenase (short-subunit alcohol dehydrogenase family)